MGLKEDAMWKMAEKMGMPKSAIEAIKACLLYTSDAADE